MPEHIFGYVHVIITLKLTIFYNFGIGDTCKKKEGKFGLGTGMGGRRSSKSRK